MKRLLIAFSVLYLFSSCVTRKQLTYLQKSEGEESISSFGLKRIKYKVQPNDILSITVRSFEKETSGLFNSTETGFNLNGNIGDLAFYINGFSVDPLGYIEMPVLGRLNVINKDVDEVKAIVQESLNKYFTEGSTYVNVQLAGIRFSVVGDVNNPGRYVIYQNQVNIFEALAQAGDISVVGDRKEVMILRQFEDGVKTIEVDLTDVSVLESADYFIQPNDVINIKPLPQKSWGIGTNGFQTFASVVGVLASTITLIVALNNLN